VVCVCNLSTSRIPNDRPMIELFVGTVGESMLSWRGLLLCNFVKPTLFCLLQAAMATRLEHQWSVDLGHPARKHPPRAPRVPRVPAHLFGEWSDRAPWARSPTAGPKTSEWKTTSNASDAFFPPAIAVTPTRCGPSLGGSKSSGGFRSHLIYWCLVGNGGCWDDFFHSHGLDHFPIPHV
jgi:hypothetical protein